MGETALGQTVFLNRIPVLDSSLRTTVYEIELFDRAVPPAPGPTRIHSGQRLSEILSSIDPRKLLGDRKAIVKIDPKDVNTRFDQEWQRRLIFEIPSVCFSDRHPAVMKRCVDGIQEWCVNESGAPDSAGCIPVNCLQKIDVSQFGEAELAARVKAFQAGASRIIATSVAERRQFEMCARVGIRLVMGDFYTEPPSVCRRAIAPNQALLLDLSAKANQDGDIREIEKIIKQNADLTFGLLNLINSAYFSVTEHVASIRQAIALLGYENLRKWVSLLLFSIERSNLDADPLFEKALIRARAMELAAAKLRRKGLTSSAYITGVFSLVPALFDVPINEILSKGNFIEEINQALIEGTGVLGDLLIAVGEIELGRHETFKSPTQLGLTTEDLCAAHTAAIVERVVPVGQEQSGRSVASVRQNYPVADVSGSSGQKGTNDRQRRTPWIWRLLAKLGLTIRHGSVPS